MGCRDVPEKKCANETMTTQQPTGKNRQNEVAVEGAEAKMTPITGESVMERTNGKVGEVLARLETELRKIKEGAEHEARNKNDHRNREAVRASNNNWEDARTLQMLHNTQVLAELKKFYDHTKYWYGKFSEWHVNDPFKNGYARWCHVRARDLSWQAYMDVKALHGEVISGDMQLVQIFHLQPLTNKCETGFNIKYKSGYESTKKVESSLHTKVAAQAKVGAVQFLSSASVSAEVSGSISSSTSISNNAESEKNFFLKLSDCSAGVYAYQTKFNNQLGDDSTLSVWGVGLMICNSPMCRDGPGKMCANETTTTQQPATD